MVINRDKQIEKTKKIDEGRMRIGIIGGEIVEKYGINMEEPFGRDE